MKKLTKVALALAVAGCFATSALAQTAAAPAAAEAPDKLQFAAKTADGKEWTQKSIKGKKSVLVFVQAACTQCRSEVNELKNKAEGIKGKGADLYLVVVDVNSERALEFFKGQGAPGTIILDPDFAVGAVVDVAATPATVVIDKDLSILSAKTGYRPGDIDKLISGL